MRSSQGMTGRAPFVPHATVVVQTCDTCWGWVITGQEPETLAEAGEFGLIAALSAWFPPGPATLVGIGDDAAVLAVPDGRVVATTDFLIEGRHFRRDWASAADVGHKAAARSLADIAAMGAEPSARLGDLAGRNPVLRSGAAPGDLVAVAGQLGHAAAGLALLTTGIAHDPRLTPLISGQLRPSPPYDAGPEAAGLGATAMIDVSDGLLADLGHIADASRVRIGLDSASLRPGDRLVTAARAVSGADRHVSGDRTGLVTRPAHDVALDWVLTGGEDHALAATFPSGTRLPPR